MKKLAIGILGAAFIFGAGTYTFAQVNGEGDGTQNFGQMKPYMEKMHPGLSTKELKEMYDSCHGSKGMMQGRSEMMQGNDSENMMNNL
ncbi:hypothetical protein [Bacillus sp. 03113]|uniref:hypothetical protein n=1 Tax=Bacillus sp. 03113 TaxID=2578211 RepID=UPI00114500CD|nr:hypothetical protein [Bacillus sp. 03113]